MPAVNGTTDTLHQVNTQLLCGSVTVSCCTVVFVGSGRSSGPLLGCRFGFGCFFTSMQAFRAVDTNSCGFPWCWELILEELAVASGSHIPYVGRIIMESQSGLGSKAP